MTNWGAEAANLNENFDKVSTAIEQVKNATIKCKGYFSSESALKLAIPTAAKGDKAYVGNNYPYQIWIWDGSSWGDSGSVGGEESVNLGNYHTKEYTDAKLSELGSNESRTYQGEHNAYSSIKFSENPLKEGGILFNRGVSVTIANINDNSIKNTISSGTEFLLPYTAKGSLLCGATSGTVDLEYHYYNGKKNAIDTKKELEGIDSNRVLKSNNKNLIIVENLINNFFINNTGGFSSNSSYSITEYIPIDAMTDYYLSRANGTYPGSNATYWNIYDKNLNIIFSGNTALISTPQDAKYLRCTLENSTVHSIMLEKGNTRTEFVKGSPIAGYIKDVEQTLSNVSQTLGDVSSNVYSTSKIDYYGDDDKITELESKLLW